MENLERQKEDLKLKVFNHKLNYLIIVIGIVSAVIAAISLFDSQTVNVGQHMKSISGSSFELYGRGVYHNDSISMAAQARGQDFVTLFLGVPFLFFAMILNQRKSRRGRFFLAGTLAYFLYTYTMYCFSGTYNRFFIFYVLLTSLSFFMFVACVTSFDLDKMKQGFTSKLPIKYLAISNIVFAALIGVNWLGYLKEPTTSLKLEHYTTFPIQAMDLGLVLPVIVFSSVMLLRKQNWGYLLLPIMTMKGLTLLLALDAMILFMSINGVEVSLAEILIFSGYTLVVALNFYLIQKNIKSDSLVDLETGRQESHQSFKHEDELTRRA
ncbi:MAG: hypothetical protein LBV19_06400 [Streptococcaceae bacterium]|jgi:hypothetical protein|nr:hypothetical protein [Streptococcaceae bacterium]